MSNTANNSLSQIRKTEEDAMKMIAQAKKTRDEKIAKKQTELQKDFASVEKELKENAKKEISVYKDELTDKAKSLLHDSKKEADQLAVSLSAKIGLAADQGMNILKTSLDIK